MPEGCNRRRFRPDRQPEIAFGPPVSRIDWRARHVLKLCQILAGLGRRPSGYIFQRLLFYFVHMERGIDTWGFEDEV